MELHISLEVFTALVVIVFGHGPDKKDSNVGVDIVKRELNWNDDNYIVSNKDDNLKIDYLQPHERNVEVLDNEDYMAFTLYKRNGRQEVPNTGLFHFIDSSKVTQYRTNCQRETMHEAAYYYFYSKCPQDDTDIVASGYCYQGSTGRGLVFNSYTFNSAEMTYVDGQYYLTDNSQKVNSHEQSLIKQCFNSWKQSGFKVGSWKCPTAGVRSSPAEPVNSREKRSDGVCTGCDCTDRSEAQSFQSSLQLVLSLVLMAQVTFISM